MIVVLPRPHGRDHRSNDPRGKKLKDFTELTLDTGAPPGDAMVKLPGPDTAVSPESTVGGRLLVNTIGSADCWSMNPVDWLSGWR